MFSVFDFTVAWCFLLCAAFFPASSMYFSFIISSFLMSLCVGEWTLNGTTKFLPLSLAVAAIVIARGICRSVRPTPSDGGKNIQAIWRILLLGCLYSWMRQISLYIWPVEGGVEQWNSGFIVQSTFSADSGFKLEIFSLLLISSLFFFGWMREVIGRSERALTCVRIMAVLTAAWAIALVAFASSGWTDPAYLLRNSSSQTASGHTSISGINLAQGWGEMFGLRTAGWALEPSLCAHLIIAGSCLVLPRILFEGSSRLQSLMSLAVLVIGGFATGTRSALLGILYLSIAAFAVPLICRVRVGRRTFMATGLILTVAIHASTLIVITDDDFAEGQVPSALMLGPESSEYSSTERISSIQAGWSAFKQAPLFGVGLGQITVHDTTLNILGNLGIVGGCIFFTFILLGTSYVLRTWLLVRNMGKRGTELALMTGILLMWFWVMAVGSVTGWPYAHAYYWVFIAIIFSVCVDVEKRQGEIGTSPVLERERAASPGVCIPNSGKALRALETTAGPTNAAI